MNQCIVYKNQENNVSVIYPSKEFDNNILLIAEKDVPAGTYFKILNIEDLPPRDSRAAWTIDLNEENSDGKGLTKIEFDLKYPNFSFMGVIE
jgi:hypothetical protein